MLSYSERCFLNVNVIMLLLWWKSIGGFPGPSVRIRAITVTLVPNALWVGSIPPPTLHPFTYFSRDQLPRRTSGPPNKVSCFMPWEPLRMKLLPLPGCPCPSLRPPPHHAAPNLPGKHLLTLQESASGPSSSFCLVFSHPHHPGSTAFCHTPNILPS